MIQIAVCDDTMKDLFYIESLLGKYKEQHVQVTWKVSTFTDSTQLLEEIKEGAVFDLYLLDMIMPQKTGIDVAEEIRVKQKDCAIIYVTSSKDYALEAYGVSAQRYLLKPIVEEELFEALDYALSHFTYCADPIFSLKTNEGIVSIPYPSIEYVECFERTVRVFLTNSKRFDSIFIRQSFENVVEALLVCGSFLHSHKSFVCNMAEIAIFSPDQITMKSGILIPVSKTKQADAKRTYLSYMTNRYR